MEYMFRGVQLRNGVLLKTRHLFQLQLHVIKHTKSKRMFIIHGDARVDGRIRVNKVPRRMAIRQVVLEEVAAEFEDAFGSVV
jgi:hypothetical protein